MIDVMISVNQKFLHQVYVDEQTVIPMLTMLQVMLQTFSVLQVCQVVQNFQHNEWQ